MGAKYTQGQKQATKNYMMDKHVIRVTVKKDKAEIYRKKAQEKGMSLNRFIIECIEKQMD